MKSNKKDFSQKYWSDIFDSYRARWLNLHLEERGLAAKLTMLVELVGGRSIAAGLMGVSVTTVDNYRTGATQPKLLEVLRLTKCASISIYFLLNGSTYWELLTEEDTGAELALLGNFQQWEDDAFDENVPRDSALDIPFGNNEDHPDQTNQVNDGHSGAIKTAPVVGLAACGSDGWAHLANSHFNAEIPLQIKNDPDAFAVISTGSSMQPFGIYEGYLCWCSPAMALKVGHIVCIERRNQTTGEAMLTIKKLGVIGHGAYEIIGYEPAIETPSDATHAIETQKVFWETVPENEIERISVVTHILTTPTIR